MEIAAAAYWRCLLQYKERRHGTHPKTSSTVTSAVKSTIYNVAQEMKTREHLLALIDIFKLNFIIDTSITVRQLRFRFNRR